MPRHIHPQRLIHPSYKTAAITPATAASTPAALRAKLAAPLVLEGEPAELVAVPDEAASSLPEAAVDWASMAVVVVLPVAAAGALVVLEGNWLA